MVSSIQSFLRRISVLLPLALLAQHAAGETRLAADDFEGSLDQWIEKSPGFARIIEEPNASNRVLELTPKPRGFSHVLLSGSESFEHVRMKGRFLFPTEGDGYLGFIYNHQQTDNRTDFGCLYVKSNGSYIRMSPHYDGNPSWRLYEELRIDLEGPRRVQTGVWYDFRLDVRANHAMLYIDDMSAPIAEFGLFPHMKGSLGLEARPGGGEPVWVDDIHVVNLNKSGIAAKTYESPVSGFSQWEVYRGPVETDDDFTSAPALDRKRWYPISPDSRGAVISGLLTQYRSGDERVAYLRTGFDAGDAPAAGWLAYSSANRLDVWLNGFYRGSVAPDRFIWSDHATSAGHPGARLPILPSAGANEVLVRVHGDTFAAGGFFADLITPDIERPR